MALRFLLSPHSIHFLMLNQAMQPGQNTGGVQLLVVKVLRRPRHSVWHALRRYAASRVWEVQAELGHLRVSVAVRLDKPCLRYKLDLCKVCKGTLA